MAKMTQKASGPQLPLGKGADHGRIVAQTNQARCLDSAQLGQLESAFRQWAAGSPRADVGLARRRILLVFLLIRYTGAKLNEVLALNPMDDIDFEHQTVTYRGGGPDGPASPRVVQISGSLGNEIQAALADPAFGGRQAAVFGVDPGFVRRKFYERAAACGFDKHLGGPEMIRKARAVELMQASLPLPAVQKLLGHSTPNLTSSYVAFSEEEIGEVTRLYMEREATRKTSARNSFFGKIQRIVKGDIQTLVELVTVGGHAITTVITNDSLALLGLKKGRLVTAEVKAPWVIVQKGEGDPQCSAENRLEGTIARITRGRVNTEVATRLDDATEVCAVVTTTRGRRLGLVEGDRVRVLFNAYTVVLHVE